MKVQISAGMVAALGGDDRGDPERARRFRATTCICTRSWSAAPRDFRRFVDLPDALAAADGDDVEREWRIHFHVPLFRESLGALRSTQPYVAALLGLLRRHAYGGHLEVETYTWDVLPAAYRGEPVVTAIARELTWVREQSRTVTWRAALRLGRVSNLPTVWTNVLAAAVLAGAPPASIGVPLAALACSLFYVGGMFLNDAFDREFDARVRPERPIPSGAVSAAAVFAIGLRAPGVGDAGDHPHGCASRLAAPTGAAVMAALALVGLIVLYDVWHKDNPFGPLLMGLCRVLVYVTTALALTGDVSLRVLGGAVVLLSYLMGLTYVARQENLADVRQRWPFCLLAVPFSSGCGCCSTEALGALFYLGLLGWVALRCVAPRLAGTSRRAACGRQPDRRHRTARRAVDGGSGCDGACPSRRPRLRAHAGAAALGSRDLT